MTLTGEQVLAKTDQPQQSLGSQVPTGEDRSTCV